jgi:signal peptidase II
VVALIAGALVVYFFWRTPRTDDRVLGALALLLAGIAGNVTDRIRLGFVVDFIDVQFGTWHYPTFNVADMAIVTGAGLMILDMFLSKRKQRNADFGPRRKADQSPRSHVP